MEATIDKTRFIFSNGKNPRGFGCWFFEIGKNQIWFTGMFTQAVQMAKKYAKSVKIDTIVVMP